MCFGVLISPFSYVDVNRHAGGGSHLFQKDKLDYLVLTKAKENS